MPAALHLRHNAVSGLRRIASAEPLLPFLYNTRTIRTQYTDALSDFEKQIEGPSRRDGHAGGRKPHARGFGAGRSGRDGKWKKPTFESGGAQGDEDFSSERPGYHDRRQTRAEHVPFEHVAQETESVREKISSSSMTPAEKKAFEELLSLQAKKQSQRGEKSADPIDEIMTNAAKQREKREIRELPEELDKMKNELSEDEQASTVLLRQAVEADVLQIEKACEGAQTDVELWKVMHDKVLSRVAALNLDGPPPALSPSRKRKYRASKDSTTATSPWKGDVADELVITRTLARHLVACQRALLTAFPASQLSVSLLPYLKTLGPTTFALASGSTLYNLHMRALFRYSTDLPAIISTLEEMDKHVYDLDEKSSRVLDIIVRKSKSARNGTYGEGLAGLWTGERFSKWKGSAFHWRGKVEARMQERALREARDKEDHPVRYVKESMTPSE